MRRVDFESTRQGSTPCLSAKLPGNVGSNPTAAEWRRSSKGRTPGVVKFMDVLNSAVLVLNTAYEGINVISAKRAMVLVCGGKAVVQETTGRVIRTSKISLPVPAVIRLLVYRYVPRQTRSVSRKAIMTRDGHRCQYCAVVLPTAKLTLDHVTPKSRGGLSSWENLVACCYPCNNRKGDRLPAEAKMVLARQPRKFGLHARHRLLGQGSEAWEKYLFC